MPQPKRGLGKGLGALIPSGPPPSVAMPGAGLPGGTCRATARMLSRSRTGQPRSKAPTWRKCQSARSRRTRVSPGRCSTRTRSPSWPRRSARSGLLQPVVVRKLGSGRYELIMGERRWRASQLAGVEVIPAIVRDTSDDDMLRDALIENLHREQLNPLEEAAAYQQLLDDFAATHEELARRVGRSRPHISNTIRLLNLPPAVQKRVAAGVLSAGHARALLGVEDPAAQEQLAHRIVAEGLSVRAVEELVALGVRPAKAPRAPGGAGAGRAGAEGSGRPALGCIRDPGEGGARPAQGQDRGRVRLAGGSGADRPHDVSRPQSRPPDLGRRGCGRNWPRR